MEERRNAPDNAELPPELILKGKAQLDAEIKIIEGWLAELDEASKDNPEALAARKNYLDMLQSRRDLLQSLNEHGQEAP